MSRLRIDRLVSLGILLVVMVLGYQNCARFDAGGVSTLSNSTLASSDPSTTTPPAPGSSVPSGPKPVWADEFDAFALWDAKAKTGKWQGFSLNGTDGGIGWSAEYDASPLDPTLGPSIYQVANGNLTIRTLKADPAIQGKLAGKSYLSGALRTRGPGFGYGYFEMRAVQPKGNGFWPAFWLLPNDGAWPPEIDILEGLGNAPSVVHTTVHSKVDQNGKIKVDGKNWSVGTGTDVKVDTSADFHTYGCDFRADFITFYFDGKQIYQAPTPPDLVNRPMYIVLDTAVGGWNGNKVDATTQFPGEFVIDYVRVYD